MDSEVNKNERRRAAAFCVAPAPPPRGGGGPGARESACGVARGQRGSQCEVCCFVCLQFVARARVVSPEYILGSAGDTKGYLVAGG